MSEATAKKTQQINKQIDISQNKQKILNDTTQHDSQQKICKAS